MHRKGVETLPEEIAAQALLAANMEFFYHGREVFERRRAQILEVAEVTGITPYLGGLSTYNDLCDRFYGRVPNKGVLDEPLVPLA
jgi:hypothetical protein